MWPSFRSSWSRRLNRHLLSQQMRNAIPGLAEAVVLTTLPIVADLVKAVPARRWVYYCVDDFGAWPGLDSQTMQATEKLLVSRCDLLVAAGENLALRLERMGGHPQILTHGVDLTWWQERATAGAPQVLATMERPIVVFWGLIDPRLNSVWLKTLNYKMPAGSIVLAGPFQDADPALYKLTRVKRIGPIPFDQLPALAGSSDTLIMPYADLPVTRAMQPLKLKEYLATGKPVVTSRLPAVEAWTDCLDAAENAEQFAQLVIERCGSGLPSSQLAARKRLTREAWSEKARILREVLFREA
jgi:glycosyltransferase involved in cell wall biosynthesis